MKVLLAYTNDAEKDNPFVKTLKDGLGRLGCDIHWGLEEFWMNYAKYEVIHINWPNSLFETGKPTKTEVIFLERIIKEIKEKSIKIVYTRHNETPHYSTDANTLKCYQIIEQNADAIVHLGNYGIKEFKEITKCKHFIIPHHIYDSIYSNNITLKEARSKLGIPLNKFVFLTFGVYRDREEVDLVLAAYKRIKIKNKLLLAPRLKAHFGFSKRPASRSIRTWLMYIYVEGIKFIKRKLEFRKHSIFALNDFVSDNDLPLYFLAANVVLIQRTKILNSGNLPMAYYFKKMVIGPNVGNVGEILNETNNIAFETNSDESFVNALKLSYTIAKDEIEVNNYNYAMRFWNTDRIARKYLDVYQELKYG